MNYYHFNSYTVTHIFFLGKTTVARLYGRLLKEFGYLSDGDLIEVKPSDLKGQAQGEAAAKVASIIDNAQGNVLFIDEVELLILLLLFT